jgi:hypothetical protein
VIARLLSAAARLLAMALAFPALANNAVLNGGFEEGGDPPRSWVQDVAKTGNKGTIALDTARSRSGHACLRMQPNGRNGPPQQLAVSQELSLGAYRGKPVEISAALLTEGEAVALVGLLVIDRSGPRLLQLEPVSGRRDWVRQARTVEITGDASARYMIALWVDGQSGTAWFDDVSVAPPGAEAPERRARDLAAPAAAASAGGPPGGASYDAWNPPLGEPVRNLTLTEGWTDARLVAQPVNTPGTGGWTDSVTASRDGKRLYFGYTKWDYFTFESTQKFAPTGPDRTSSYSGNELQIYQADLGSSGWTISHHPINLGVNISAASMGLNSAEDVMVYNTYEFKPTYRTGMQLATRSGNAWSRRGPLPAPINSSAGCLDDNGFIVGSLSSGATLYFESTRSTLNGSRCGKDRHLHFATYQNGAWSDVQAVSGANSTSAGDNDQQPFLSEDRSRIYWLASRLAQGKYGIFTAEGNGRSFSNARMIIGISTFKAPWANKVVRLGEPNVVMLPQGLAMYFMCGIALGDTKRGEPDNIQYKVCFARKPN